MWRRVSRLKISWDFAVLFKVTGKGEVYCFGFFGRGQTGGCHLLDANNVEAEAHRP
jgi:hypothetical protein